MSLEIEATVPPRQPATYTKLLQDFLATRQRWHHEDAGASCQLSLHVRFELDRDQYTAAMRRGCLYDSVTFDALWAIEDQLAKYVIQGGELPQAETDLAYQRVLWLRAARLDPSCTDVTGEYVPAIDRRLKRCTARRLQEVIEQQEAKEAAKLREQHQSLKDLLQTLQDPQ